MKSIKNWIENNLIRYALWKDPSDSRFIRLLEQLGDIEHDGYFYTFLFSRYHLRCVCVYRRPIKDSFDEIKDKRVGMEEYIPVMKKLYPKLARQIFFRLHLF